MVVRARAGGAAALRVSGVIQQGGRNENAITEAGFSIVAQSTVMAMIKKAVEVPRRACRGVEQGNGPTDV